MGLAPLGNVQVRHDFEAAGERWNHLGRQGFKGVLQHAIEPQPHMQAVFLRFDMDVAGLAAEGLHQDAIGQLDHRRGIAIVDALHQVRPIRWRWWRKAFKAVVEFEAFQRCWLNFLCFQDGWVFRP